MSNDNTNLIFQKFFKERTENLFDRFTGTYRAVVEETNDPLRIGRIRVRIPELHNKDIKRDELPWATSAQPSGGKGNGWWHGLIIGDIVYVQFEKNHPYAPIVIGSADPTRRKFYPLQSIHGETPLAVNEKGEPAGRPNDFLKEYLPKDERPMSVGVRDRYGTFFMLNSVGFFPKEHVEKPAAVGTDAITQSAFKAAREQPQSNEPDLKYAILHTKYGHTLVLSDVGYEWDKEFDGDHTEDENFEILRHKYLQKFFNEQESKEHDQRRIELRTRYGHKFELRDVGFTKNRPGEFDQQIEISKEDERDERWAKIRTKGGMIIQAIDKGNDPEKDKFVKELLQTDKGSDLDGENEDDFQDDARQIRMITRHGAKLALDDRGSDKVDASNKEDPHGNGMLLRTRRGFTIDANDKDPTNRLQIVSPKSKIFEINDRFDYIMASTDTAEKIVEDFKGTKSNEFSTTIALTHDPERTSYHFKLDKENHYISMKTPEGQGIEFRDTEAPCQSFSEQTGPEDRGMYMSRNDNLAVWRDKLNKMYVSLDDSKQLILVRNELDKIQIFADGNVEVISKKDVRIRADQKIHMSAGQDICMDVNGTQWTVQNGHVGSNSEVRCRRLNAITMFGTHESIQIPTHPLLPAPPGSMTSCILTKPTEEETVPRKPKPFNEGRNCAPNKQEATPVPPETFSGGGGGFGQPPSSPSTPPSPSPFRPPSTPNVTVNPTPEAEDPLEQSGGVLFYGVSNVFKNEILNEFGICLDSFANNENIPPDTDADKIILFFDTAQANKAATKSKKIHGGQSLIIRATSVPDSSLLIYKADERIAEYHGNIPPDGLEFFEEEPT